MENCRNQPQLQSSRLVLLKLKQALYHLQQAINVFQQDHPSNLEVIKQSQQTQGFLDEACDLLVRYHLNSYVADLIKKGEIENATKEIKHLHRYKF